MKVLVTGASGAIGKQLVPKLVSAGHTVTGITTSPEKREMLRGLGAEPVVADVLDAEEIGAVVAAASPEAIIHEATALAGDLDIRHFDRSFAVTNRLRSEGTDNLLAAGIRVPTIIVTAHDEGDYRQRCASAGVAAYLLKPLDREAVVSAIGKALDPASKAGS